MVVDAFDQSTTADIDPVSAELRLLFQIVVYVALCGLVSVLGIAGNVVNIIVFVRQGSKETINVSLLGLAVADLGSSLAMFWMSVATNPLFVTYYLTFNGFEVSYVTGAGPHACFNRITSFITVFITLERCLCITIPLKVKNTITPYRAKVIVLSIFVTVHILFSPFYFVNRLAWVYDHLLNRTILGVVYTEDRVAVETATFPIHGVGLSAISLVLVVIFTVIIIVQLNKKTNWRKISVAQNRSKPDISTIKEKRVVKMVTFISVIYIFCYFPAAVNFFLMAYNPEFSVAGKYEKLFFVLWSMTALFETFNSSVNIVLYLKMSSKYKAAFVQTFCCCVGSSKSVGK